MAKLKVKMQHLGVRQKPIKSVARSSGPTIDYPNLHITSKHMDGLDGMAHGSRHHLEFDAVVDGISSEDYGDGKRTNVRFRLTHGRHSPLAAKHKSTHEAKQGAMTEMGMTPEVS